MLAFTLLLLLFAQATPGPDAGPAPSASLPAELSSYRSWPQATTAPVPVPETLWALCAAPSRVLPSSEQKHGPHGDRFLRVFANDAARAPLASHGVPHFPVGAAIVKEKLLRSNDGKPSAIGAMVKRAPGFDPSAGDWEFLYLAPDGTLTRGKAATAGCRDCHRAKAAEDFVFRPYVEKSAAGPAR